MKLKKISIALFTGLCAAAAFSQSSDDVHPCFDADDYLGCQYGIEKGVIEKSSGIAQRQGDNLCVTPEQGEPVCFKNVAQESDLRAYYFYDGQLPQWPSIVWVDSVHWEHSEYRFISLKNGKVVFAFDGQRDMGVSPDGKYIAFAMEDTANAYYDNEVWIYEVSDQKEWTKVWSNKDEGDGYAKPQWKSNDELVVVRTGTDENGDSISVGELIVSKDGAGWKSSKQDKNSN